MSKLLKFTLIIIAVFIGLVLLLVLLLPTLADTQTFRDQLSAQVKQHTGQTLTIEGDLSLSVFPWLGIRTETVRLSQPPSLTAADADKDFIRMAGADIQIKLLPLLLKRQLQMQQIRLNQPTIRYLVDSKGRSSIDGLTSNTEPAITGDAVATSTESSAAPLSGLFIAGITISNGQLIYDNRQTRDYYEINQLILDTGDLLGGSPAKVNVSAQLATADQGITPVMVDVSTTAILTLAEQFIELKDSKLTVNQQQDNFIAKIAELTFSGTTQQLSWRQLQLSGQAQQIIEQPLSPQITLPQGTINLAEQSTSAIEFTLNENNSGATSKGVIEAKDWSENLIFKGRIDSTTLNPRSVMSLLATDYKPTDNAVMKKFVLSTDFNGSTQGIALKNIKLNLDDSNLTGDLAMTNFANPGYRFDLSLDSINLDRYLPVIEEKQTATKDSASTNLALSAPMAIFKQINANGIVRAKQLLADGAILSDILLKITSSKGQVVVEHKATAYSGNITGKMTFVDNGKQSTLTVDNTIDKVNIQPLLIDTKITDQLSGLASIATNVVFTEIDGKQTNKGSIGLNIKDGALKAINILKVLGDAQAELDRLRGKSTQATQEGKNETRFSELATTLLLNNNVISSNDLAIKAPTFRITGKGGIELEKQALNYLTTIIYDGADKENLRGLSIPVTFSGPITQPKYTIDFKSIAKASTDKKVDGKKSELKEKAAEKLGIKTEENAPPKSTEDVIKEEAKKKLLEKLFR